MRLFKTVSLALLSRSWRGNSLYGEATVATSIAKERGKSFIDESTVGFTNVQTSCDAFPSSNSGDAGRSGRTTRQQFLADTIKASNVESYHLIWSTGALKKLAIGTVTLFLANSISSVMGGGDFFQNVVDWMSQSTYHPLASFVSNIVLPLLASACCMLQLWINLLAGGCAGFNTVLGPVRPYFLSLLLYFTFTTARWRQPQWYGVSAARWSVALLPEALHVFNRYLEDRQKRTAAAKVRTMPWQATIQLDIPTMGCVACINKIDAALRNVAPDRVVEAEAALNPLGAKGGQAKVRVMATSRDEIDQLLESLVLSVEKAGFAPCHLQSMDVALN